ncbi:MAG: hypothetical protein VBE63_27125 [Lamprobacter sp.]|uniref:hypothetical protein n=1 Tax=Lamprobacter sp. TaxID=3100796 RepID=UPI002B256B2A|nr:hypothetical protein [Lamprobacter sp.]MEA3643571.1 hypothetical protein [Lamprobacter sp.]
MSDPEPTPWQLFRYRHAHGGSKDWAYRCRTDGDLEVCWGRTGQVSQQRRYPARVGLSILRLAAEKQAKGYVLLGQAVLKDQRLELFSTPLSASSASTPAPSPPPPQALPTASAVDLSRIAVGEDDFWF